MQKPPLDPGVADNAPMDSVLTRYDHEHIITYLRLLDADAEGADWREVARIVLHRDPERVEDHARRAFDSHLARAKWSPSRATDSCSAVAELADNAPTSRRRIVEKHARHRLEITTYRLTTRNRAPMTAWSS
jgi:hypothetical protein